MILGQSCTLGFDDGCGSPVHEAGVGELGFLSFDEAETFLLFLFVLGNLGRHVDQILHVDEDFHPGHGGLAGHRWWNNRGTDVGSRCVGHGLEVSGHRLQKGGGGGVALDAELDGIPWRDVLPAPDFSQGSEGGLECGEAGFGRFVLMAGIWARPGGR